MDWYKTIYNRYRSIYSLDKTNNNPTNAMASFGMNYASSNKAKSKRKKNKRRRK